jgi:hypothetical protein
MDAQCESKYRNSIGHVGIENEMID